MPSNESKLQNLLLEVGDRLSNENRQQIGFLLRGEVPARLIEEIVYNIRVPMTGIWEALIDRQKISPENLDYLIGLLQGISRLDLVRHVKKYLSTIETDHETTTSQSNCSSLFKRIDPSN